MKKHPNLLLVIVVLSPVSVSAETIILKGATVCRSFEAAKNMQWADERGMAALVRAGKCYTARGDAQTLSAEAGPDIVEFRTADNPSVAKFTLVEFTASRTISPKSAMSCRNPRREYRAVFDETSRRFIVDSGTEYKVLAVENTPEQFVVAGATVNDGPSFRAQFRPTKKIEFFVNSKLFQTDPCR